MKLHCALCGRLTLQPAAWIGIYPVGSTCARKAGLAKFARARGAKVVIGTGARIPRVRRDGRTQDMFEGAS